MFPEPGRYFFLNQGVFMQFFERLGTKVILGLFAMPCLHSGPCCSISVCANGLSLKNLQYFGAKRAGRRAE